MRRTNTHKYDVIASKAMGEAMKAVLDNGEDVDTALNEAKPKIEEQVAAKK